MRPALFAALLASAVLSACGGEADAARSTKLVFGIPSTESSIQLERSWAPFLVDLGRDLDVTVEPFYATDYSGVVEAMRAGHVDLAWFGNKAAIMAADRAGGEVFCQMVDGDGNPGYWSVIVVQADGDLHTVDDLFRAPDQLKIGIGDPNSTSGHLVPMAQLFGPRGLDPKRDFGRALVGNHESNAIAVALGHVDAAPVDSKVLRRFERSHPDKAAKLRELWRSELIPSDAICWRKGLPDNVRERLRDWFTTYGRNEHERAVLKGLDLAGFRSSSNAQLVPIRELELLRERLRLESADMDEATRQRELGALEAKRSALRAGTQGGSR
jgi:phosphonate transport system substrate-binding protein